MKKLLFLCGLLSLQEQGMATIRYVKAGGSGTQTGASWADASGDLQLMINQSSSTALDTIWVAAGTYVPNRPADDLNTIDADNRNNAFTFTKNVRMYGGFPATGTPSWTDRSWQTHATLLSGDIGTPADNTDNAYHVVITAGAAVDADFMMDGFTITDGMANLATGITVGGVLIQERMGAGWNNSDASPRARNLVITNNVIGSEGTGFGIGFHTRNGSPELSNVIFRNNMGTASRGGAGTNFGGQLTLNNVIMQGNLANAGGAWHNMGSGAVTTMNNVTITGNSAVAAGACYLDNGTINFNNCIVFNNETSGGGLAIETMGIPFPSVANYNHCLIQGVAGGSNGNLDGTSLEPLFTNPLPGSAAPTAAGDYRLLVTSPCIDAGDNTLLPADLLSDLDGNERIADGIVDMGAYEFGSVPLSVALTHFSATISGCTVHLLWHTANETELSHYEVEAAGAARDFKPVGSVNALNQDRSTYYFDIGQEEATVYYRLRSVSKDGADKHSAILPVSVACYPAAVVKAYPNPATQLLHVAGVAAGQALQLIDVHGRSLIQETIADAKTSVSLTSCLPGIYQLIISSASGERIASLPVVVQ